MKTITVIFNQYTIGLCIMLLLCTCRVEKNDYQVKRLKPDTLIRQHNSGTVNKTLGKINKTERAGLLFDQYVSSDFHFPKNKKDSAAIVNYFIKTSYDQLGRRKFRDWDIVVVRGVVFQVNIEKDDPNNKPWKQKKIELMGIIFVLLGFYFL